MMEGFDYFQVHTINLFIMVAFSKWCLVKKKKKCNKKHSMLYYIKYNSPTKNVQIHVIHPLPFLSQHHGSLSLWL